MVADIVEYPEVSPLDYSRCAVCRRPMFFEIPNWLHWDPRITDHTACEPA